MVVPRTRTPIEKPALTTKTLLDGGFKRAGLWVITEQGEIASDIELPKEAGVYAFAQGGIVVYVGVATSQLQRRFHFYGRPGRT